MESPLIRHNPGSVPSPWGGLGWGSLFSVDSPSSSITTANGMLELSITIVLRFGVALQSLNCSEPGPNPFRTRRVSKGKSRTLADAAGSDSMLATDVQSHSHHPRVGWRR